MTMLTVSAAPRTVKAKTEHQIERDSAKKERRRRC
jgi:hypothetical protein